MLESLVKLVFFSMIIVLFFVFCLQFLNDSANESLLIVEHSVLLNSLTDESSSSDGQLVVCKPSLVNNVPGRACVAS